MKKVIFILSLVSIMLSNAQKVEVKSETIGNVTKIDFYAQAKNDLYDIMQVVVMNEERQNILFNTLLSKYEFKNEHQTMYSAEELKSMASRMSEKLPVVFTAQEMAAVKLSSSELYVRVFE